MVLDKIFKHFSLFFSYVKIHPPPSPCIVAAPYPGNYNLNKLEFLLPNDAFTNVSFQLSCPNGFQENFLLFVPIIKSNPLIYALFFPRGSWFEQKMVCSLPVDVSTQGTTFLVKWFGEKYFLKKSKTSIFLN